jgi:hypothetical protein
MLLFLYPLGHGKIKVAFDRAYRTIPKMRPAFAYRVSVVRLETSNIKIDDLSDKIQST